MGYVREVRKDGIHFARRTLCVMGAVGFLCLLNACTVGQILRSAKLARLSASDRRKLAESETTPPETLRLLATDTDPHVHWRLAGNPNTPKEVLAELARDKDVDIRSKVASNQGAPHDILATLARDENVAVRSEVASNRRTPPDILATLTRDEDDGVRLNVARNLNTPGAVLTNLKVDDLNIIRKSVDVLRHTRIKGSLDPLLRCLVIHHQNRQMQGRMADALWAQCEQPPKDLFQRLNSEEPQLRLAAAIALGHLMSRRAAIALPYTRWMQETIERLEVRLAIEKDDTVKAALTAATEKIRVAMHAPPLR